MQCCRSGCLRRNRGRQNGPWAPCGLHADCAGWSPVPGRYVDSLPHHQAALLLCAPLCVIIYAVIVTFTLHVILSY